jgi:hypothetical protein
MVSIEGGMTEYRRLSEYADMRKHELSRMVRPYIDVTDSYGELICTLVLALGAKAPRDMQDEVCRDLLADVFDFLYDARHVILESHFEVAFPLLRRAFESISLLFACSSDPSFAEAWASGKKISNAEVRERLSKNPVGEPLETTREMYSHFSMGAHPNRDVVPFRFLGKGNDFVLGAIGVRNLLEFCDHLRHHLSLWFWFCATVSLHYCELTDMAYGEKYLKTAGDAKEVAESLLQEIKRLRTSV